MQEFLCRTEQETEAVALWLAKRVKQGDVIALRGTLGMGKTVFARGFIHALSPDVKEVPSPTFTLLQIYDTKDFMIYHFDMYRLKSPEEAYEIGIEEAFIDGVSLIEWPEKIDSLLPKKQITVTFKATENGRLITVKGV